ncbi:MerR family transcriptional regulator [Saccharopolyspora pogona]|uniref:MerR family transcriptional regulator n=1 Tax=Saccharopolyspora pogona TaxID=333966 RepID=UPI00295BF828|nr:MerR family transcriptional regulator [Saccharopolyspora pogona]
MKVKEEMRVLIGEPSRRFGVHTNQLRYYETQGLLELSRGANGYREYRDDAVPTVIHIRKRLEAGLSTQEIGYPQPRVTGSAPDFEPCPELLDALRARLRGLDEHIDTLVRSREGPPRLHRCDGTACSKPGLRLHNAGADTSVTALWGWRRAPDLRSVKLTAWCRAVSPRRVRRT